MSAIDRTDGLVGNAAIKYPCRMASTANLTLSGTQTIDGVVGAQDDRVLVKDQTTATQNGIYVMDTGTWERAQDADNDGAFTEGSLVKVNNGTVGQGFWYITNTGTITIDTTNIAFARASTVLATLSALWQAIVILTTTLASRQALLLDMHGADIVSAANINLDTATGDVVDVTGAGGPITSITLAEGVEKVVRFTGAPTLTNGASLVLPGAANIVVAAGDYATFRGYAAGVVRCIDYQIAAVAPFDRRAPGAIGGTTPAAVTGTAITGSSAAGAMIATQAQQETASAVDVLVTPGRQQFHPSASKGWGELNINGTIAASYNISSIADTAQGIVTVSWGTDFSSGSYGVSGLAIFDSTAATATMLVIHCEASTKVGGSCVFSARRVSDGAYTDPTTWGVGSHGDQ